MNADAPGPRRAQHAGPPRRRSRPSSALVDQMTSRPSTAMTRRKVAHVLPPLAMSRSVFRHGVAASRQPRGWKRAPRPVRGARRARCLVEPRVRSRPRAPAHGHTASRVQPRRPLLSTTAGSGRASAGGPRTQAQHPFPQRPRIDAPPAPVARRRRRPTCSRTGPPTVARARERPGFPGAPTLAWGPVWPPTWLSARPSQTGCSMRSMGARMRPEGIASAAPSGPSQTGHRRERRDRARPPPTRASPPQRV